MAGPSSPPTRRFTEADQEAFAALTGDRNPMHMDSAAARRTQAGSPAVHGVHGLLWALDVLVRQGTRLGGLASIRADFSQFLHLEQPVAMVVLERDEARLRAELRAGDARITAIDLCFGPRKRAPHSVSDEGRLPERAEDPDAEAMDGLSGCIAAPAGAEDRAAALFPHLCPALGPPRVVSLGLLSTLVGMVVPGLYSIFSGLRLDLHDDGPCAAGTVAYTVRRSDPRFRLVTLTVGGDGFSGELTAFQRFPPVSPPTLADVADRVAPDAFADRRALVIGGSRGIGATTAKLLAAGGATVTLTYRSGRSEAEAIRDEIAAHRGPDACRLLRYDTAGDPVAQLAELPGPVGHLYYFATGPIFAGRGADFHPARLGGFLDAYVHGFHRLVAHLLARDRPLCVFYPSSIAVETRPQGMTEYTMAKAAGEILCTDLARAHPGLRITMPRLPRILTDQTATVPPVPAADPVEVMLPLLHAEAN